MKTKIRILNCLMIAFSLVFFMACSDDDNEEPLLSTNVTGNALQFTAEATESHEVTVVTNQGDWDAVSDQTWCKVINKTDNKFTVTGDKNNSTEAPPKATITITAGSAPPVRISVTQAGLGAILTLAPETPIRFNAKGEGSHEITVTTNQENWNALSNQTWCIVTKQGDKFTVTANENRSTEPLTAIITVSAGNAADKTITVTQEAASEPGKDKDNGKTIWEDTHLRWFKLSDKVKSIVSDNGPSYEFNSSGMLTKWHEGSSYVEEYQYDGSNRLVKITMKDAGYRSVTNKAKSTKTRSLFTRADSDTEIMEITYGNHSKYIPLIELGEAEEILFVKGVTSLKLTYGNSTQQIDFNVTANKITASLKQTDYEETIEITYSGDYPVSQITNSIETYGGQKQEYIETESYKYGINHKLSEYITKYEDKSDPDDAYGRTYKYVIDNTVYHLLDEESNSYGDHHVKYEYDEKGNLIKDTEQDGDVNEYTYKFDDKGNWIEMNNINGGEIVMTEKRTITYY